MLMAIACSSSDGPEGLLEQEKMVDIMIDIHMAEAAIQDLRLEKDSAQRVYTVQEKYIFKKHAVSDTDFLASYNYYIEHPEQLETIYTAIIDTLSLRQVLFRESAGE
jgi:hypothetical protein